MVRPLGSAQEAMWFATIMPRIAFALPASMVLEIAPGHGRCTNLLLRFTRGYRGVDLSEQCVQFCRQRFASHADAEFFVNDGKSLAAAADRMFQPDIFSTTPWSTPTWTRWRPYIPQIIQMLSAGWGGLHPPLQSRRLHLAVEHGLRSTEVSAERIAALIEKSGGRVADPGIWGGNAKANSDCFSTFCKASDHADFERRSLI